MKLTTKIFAYILTGFFSFFLFLYFSFPYQVLKESLVSKISESTGMNLFVDKFSPSFPFGLHLEKVEISVPGGKTVAIDEIHLSLSAIPLLWGRVNLSLEIGEEGGFLNAYLGFGLLDLTSMDSGLVLPRRLVVTAKEFPLGELAQLYFSKKIKDPSTNMMIKPLFEKVSVGGKLNLDVDFDFDLKDFTQSSGHANLSMNQLALNFDPSMQIPSQAFSSTVIKAVFDKGVLKFDKASELKAPELDVSLLGKVDAASNIDKSKVQASIQVTLLGELKENLAFVLDAVASETTNGRLMIDVTGTLTSPQVLMKPF